MKICKCKCGWTGSELAIHIPGHCPVCGGYEINEITKDTPELKDEDMAIVWEVIREEPTVDNDDMQFCIENDFFGFKAGTPLDDIWRWFDHHYSKGLHTLMYGETIAKDEETNGNNRIYLPLSTGDMLCVEKNPTPEFGSELIVGICDKEMNWIQDITVVREKDRKIDVLSYKDPYDENYTDSYTVDIYHGAP